jgi:AbrB family looped-hinge helix DNA binding protein
MAVEAVPRQIVATITSKGQVTIPAEVRRHLGVGAHEKITFVIDPSGGVRLERPRYPTIESLRGAAGTLPQPLTWEEMRTIAREERLLDKYGRGRRDE